MLIVQLNVQLIPNYFKNEKFVKLNTIIITNDKVKKLSCKLCDKSHARNDNLKNHMKTFHQGTKFFCNSCDKSFAQSHTLKKHIKIVHES